MTGLKFDVRKDIGSILKIAKYYYMNSVQLVKNML